MLCACFSFVSCSDDDRHSLFNPSGAPQTVKYLSPHLGLAKMYRLFVAQYQPILLEVERCAPRLTKIDRAKRRRERQQQKRVNEQNNKKKY